jgi:predicted DNA-binding antitoxin AbrB/MazE fold protein
MSSYCKDGIKLLAINALVKNGVIKPLDAIDMPEDEGIVAYAPKEKGEEEYSDWTDEEYQMMKHQEETGFAKKVLGNEKEDVRNDV